MKRKPSVSTKYHVDGSSKFEPGFRGRVLRNLKHIATAMAIPSAMSRFERNFLKKHSPCKGKNIKEIAQNIAPVHVEFLLIHPYREGNGRTARLPATLAAYQVGMSGIDFGFIRSRG